MSIVCISSLYQPLPGHPCPPGAPTRRSKGAFPSPCSIFVVAAPCLWLECWPIPTSYSSRHSCVPRSLGASRGRPWRLFPPFHRCCLVVRWLVAKFYFLSDVLSSRSIQISPGRLFFSLFFLLFSSYLFSPLFLLLALPVSVSSLLYAESKLLSRFSPWHCLFGHG